MTFDRIQLRGIDHGQEEDEQEADADQNFEDKCHSSSASGSDYKVSAESEEIIGIKNDKPDMGIIIESGGKKQKKGLMGRNQIRKICSHLSSEPSEVNSEHVGQKRKAAPIQEFYFISFFFFASQLIFIYCSSVVLKNKAQDHMSQAVY